MDDVIVGLLAIGLGLAVCFLGLRIWYFMLPIWGFVSGFFVGAATVTAIFGDGFLSTVTGWIVGIVVGLGFALLSYLFWYAGVMLAAASVGGLLASGFLDAVGIDGKWVVFLISLAAALALAFLALVIALPVYIVIISTGIVGATSVVTGAMLVLNRIELVRPPVRLGVGDDRGIVVLGRGLVPGGSSRDRVANGSNCPGQCRIPGRSLDPRQPIGSRRSHPRRPIRRLTRSARAAPGILQFTCRSMVRAKTRRPRRFSCHKCGDFGASTGINDGTHRLENAQPTSLLLPHAPCICHAFVAK